jgi:hypothetical protein
MLELISFVVAVCCLAEVALEVHRHIHTIGSVGRLLELKYDKKGLEGGKRTLPAAESLRGTPQQAG